MPAVALVVLLLSLAGLDQTILSTALPAIAADLQAQGGGRQDTSSLVRRLR